MLTLALLENGLLTIYRNIAIRLYPRRDMLVPSAGSQQGSMYALEKL
jgi:hypothetical protein